MKNAVHAYLVGEGYHPTKEQADAIVEQAQHERVNPVDALVAYMIAGGYSFEFGFVGHLDTLRGWRDWCEQKVQA